MVTKPETPAVSIVEVMARGMDGAWDDSPVGRAACCEFYARAMLRELEAAGYAIVPVEATIEMRCHGVVALGKRNGEIAKQHYDAPGREKEFAVALMADSSQTDPVWRAMVAARPR